MTSDASKEHIPNIIREITTQVLAGQEIIKSYLLKCAEWWCRNTFEDNVVTDLIVIELYCSREPTKPQAKEQLTDKRNEAIFHLRDDYPGLLPEQY